MRTKKLYPFIIIILILGIRGYGNSLSVTHIEREEDVDNLITFKADWGSLSMDGEAELAIRLRDIAGISIGSPVYKGLLHSLYYPDSVSFANIFAISHITVSPYAHGNTLALYDSYSSGIFRIGGYLLSDTEVTSVGLLGEYSEAFEILGQYDHYREDGLAELLGGHRSLESSVIGLRWSLDDALDMRYLTRLSEYGKSVSLLEFSILEEFGSFHFNIAQRAIEDGFSLVSKNLKLGRYFKVEYSKQLLSLFAQWREYHYHKEPLVFTGVYDRQYTTGLDLEFGRISYERRWSYRFMAENLLFFEESLEDSSRVTLSLDPLKMNVKTQYSYVRGEWVGDHEIGLIYDHDRLEFGLSVGMSDHTLDFTISIDYTDEILSLKKSIGESEEVLRSTISW